ncbi:hypothetical protein Tco_0017295 [Tanacetum coccineum]
MTTVGTKAIVNTRKGKLDTNLKKSRWVWRPKGNYLDHVSKDNGSFMLKKGNLEILLQDHVVWIVFDLARDWQQSLSYIDYEDFQMELWWLLEVIPKEKNSVLFTETECLILSPRFKLLDESQVVLRAPRKDDVYSLDLKNIVPTGDSLGKIDDDFWLGTRTSSKEPLEIRKKGTNRTRILVEDVASAAHEKPSKSSPKDNDVQDSEDVADKEGQHQMTEDEQVLHDELEKMIAQEVVAKALDDATRQAFEEEKEEYCNLKRGTSVPTSINKALCPSSSSVVDLAHPNQVYKVNKALLWSSCKPQKLEIVGKNKSIGQRTAKQKVNVLTDRGYQPKLGLWYPKDSPFELKAYSDSDYGGSSLDRKSTTGGCQFLGRRLISWQCKKQTIVANSTTKAEYVAAAN